MEVKYVTTSIAAKEAIWLQKFLIELRLVPLVILPLVLFCDNSRVMA